MKLILTSLVFSLCMYGCGHTYTEGDFANSKWMDSNGGIISLHSNGSCNVQDIKLDSIYPPSWLEDSAWKAKHPDSFVGHWYLNENQNDRKEIYIQIGETGYGFSFEIRNIETIEHTVGDPDDCVFYIFNRVGKNP